MKRFGLWKVLAPVLLASMVQAQAGPDTIPAGTRLRVKLETPVSTKTAHVGDAVEGRLEKPVESRGQVVLPKGVYVSGHVAQVRAAMRKEKVFARLRLVFDKVSFPDGRTLVAQALPLGDDVVYDADSEGVLTHHGVTKGGAVEDVAIGAGAGAGVGATAGGGKGAEVGAGVGAAVGTLGAWAEAASRWWNIEFIKGDKLWLRLDQDLLLDTATPNPSAPPAALFEPARSENAPVPAARPSAPAIPTSGAEDHAKTELRVFLTDRKSWEASGGFAQISESSPGQERATVRPLPAEDFKAWREHCPAIAVTADPSNADAIVLIDKQTWHSPTYPVSIFRRNGDVLYVGGTQLLRNAVKDACGAITASR